MNKVLFSIVTVCSNCESSIEKTMKSVLGQEFKDYEYIIVDGASKDKTVDVIKRYLPQFEGRMRYVSEPDKGIYDAFTKGVNMATGTYVWIVNSDDYIEPSALGQLADIITKLDNNDLPIISCAMNFVNSNGLVMVKCKSEASNLMKAYEKDDIGVTHPATLVPKSIYDKFGAYDIRYKLSGDVDWFHRVYAAGCKFKFFDNTITNMTDGGISSQYTWKRYKISLKDRKLFLSKYYNGWFSKLKHFLIWQISISKLLVKGYLKL